MPTFGQLGLLYKIIKKFFSLEKMNIAYFFMKVVPFDSGCNAEMQDIELLKKNLVFTDSREANFFIEIHRRERISKWHNFFNFGPRVKWLAPLNSAFHHD